MDIEKMREQFEASFAAHPKNQGLPEIVEGMLERGSNGEYRSMWVNGAWWGWQASREAVVVELPEPEEFDGYYNSGYAIRKENVVKAIEAQGLKVAP